MKGKKVTDFLTPNLVFLIFYFIFMMFCNIKSHVVVQHSPDDENMTMSCTGVNYFAKYCTKAFKKCKIGTHTVCMFYKQDQIHGPYCPEDFKMIQLGSYHKNYLLNEINSLRDEVVQYKARGHNENHLPRAYDVEHVKWDEDLALFAQIWANQCREMYDECRPTDKFDDPDQFITMSVLRYPDWNGSDKMGNTSQCLTPRKLQHAISKSIAKLIGDRTTRMEADIYSYPNNTLKKWYLKLVYAKLTHIGCGMSTFSGNQYQNKTTTFIYNVVQLVCNLSHKPVVGRPVYRTVANPTHANYTTNTTTQERNNQTGNGNGTNSEDNNAHDGGGNGNGTNPGDNNSNDGGGNSNGTSPGDNSANDGGGNGNGTNPGDNNANDGGGNVNGRNPGDNNANDGGGNGNGNNARDNNANDGRGNGNGTNPGDNNANDGGGNGNGNNPGDNNANDGGGNGNGNNPGDNNANDGGGNGNGTNPGDNNANDGGGNGNGNNPGENNANDGGGNGNGKNPGDNNDNDGGGDNDNGAGWLSALSGGNNIVVLPIVTLENAPQKQLRRQALSNLKGRRMQSSYQRTVQNGLQKKLPLSSKKSSIFSRVPIFNLSNPNHVNRRRKLTKSSIFSRVPIFNLSNSNHVNRRKKYEENIDKHKDNLKTLLDQVPKKDIARVEKMLQSIVNPNKHMSNIGPVKATNDMSRVLMSSLVPKAKNVTVKPGEKIIRRLQKYPNNHSDVMNTDFPVIRKLKPISHTRYSNSQNFRNMETDKNYGTKIERQKTAYIEKNEHDNHGPIEINNTKLTRRMFLVNEINKLKSKLHHLRQYIHRKDINENDHIRPLLHQNEGQKRKYEMVKEFYVPDRAHAVHEY